MRQENDTDGEKSRLKRHITPDNLGDVIGLLLAASILLLCLSIAVIFLLVLNLPEGQSTLEAPIIGWIFLISIGAIPFWLFVYSAWSFWRYRQLRAEMKESAGRSPFTRPRYLLTIVTAHDDDLSTYEKRVKLTVLSFAIGMGISLIAVREFG